jgi:hypothetical protein
MVEEKEVSVTNPCRPCKKVSLYPATEAPSEHVFSTASLLLSKFRNRMDPKLAGRMIFIKKNFEWYEEFLKKASGED